MTRLGKEKGGKGLQRDSELRHAKQGNPENGGVNEGGGGLETRGVYHLNVTRQREGKEVEGKQ